MNEKDMFLQTWEREFKTTLKVLKAFPADKLDFKPHERSMSAEDLTGLIRESERRRSTTKEK